MTERDELPPGWVFSHVPPGFETQYPFGAVRESGGGVIAKTERQAIRGAWRIHDAEKEKDA